MGLFSYLCILIASLMKDNNINILNRIDGGCAVTVGMFDGVHMGHRHLLSLLKRVADEHNLTPVVVTFDRHPRMALGKGDGMRLLMSHEKRIQTLEALGFEGHVEVIEFTPEAAQLTACQFAREYLCNRMGMKALVLGYDNMFGCKQHNDFDQLPLLAEQQGFEIFHDSAVDLDGIIVSSTKIRQAIQEGNVVLANKMLGQPFCLKGVVEKGRQVGRQIGFPTANINTENSLCILPKVGVYAVKVIMSTGESLAMANIGPKPTFEENGSTLEVNIFSECGDLYGQEIEVMFLDRIRDIVRFANAEELAMQLAADKQQILNAFAI